MRFKIKNGYLLEVWCLRNKTRKFKLVVNTKRIDLDGLQTSYSTDIDHFLRIPCTRKDGEKSSVTIDVDHYAEVIELTDILRELVCQISSSTPNQ